MEAPNAESRLRLAFRGVAFHDGAVPLMLVAAKLQALQSLLYHAAAAVKHDSAARRGLWFNRYRDIAELTFGDAHHSELVIEVDLARPPVLGGELDLGMQAVDLMFEFGDKLQKNLSEIDSLDIGKDDRTYLLRAFDSLLPDPLDTYAIEIENCAPAKHPKLLLTAATRQAVRKYFLRERAAPILETPMPVTLVGELVKIHVDVGPELIAIKHKGREIECYYQDALRDQIANLLAGSTVEVTGEATLDGQGEVVKLGVVYDVVTVSMEPLRITRFEYEGTVYALKHPLVMNVQYADDLWVYHHPSINLWGYGERREDALRDLHANFAYLWKEFAEADDSVLDEKANEIKHALLQLYEPSVAGA